MPTRLPPWLKVRLPTGESYARLKEVSARRSLATVCEEARCPNIGECWGQGTATFMVMGDSCTRGCRFCSVESLARPPLPDPLEPEKLAQTLHEMSLKYAVLTTVCRDDLEDQGAAHLSACVRAVKARCPQMKVELLAQDFRGDEALLETVLASGPDVLAHNVETVERLTYPVRDARAGYRQSLKMLAASKRLSPKTPTKSSIMLGLGETQDEVVACLKDLRAAGVDIVTLGQYLRPGGESHHLPVAEFVTPEGFTRYGELARGLGFAYVASGPFVRSSYRAGELFLHGWLEKRS